MTLSGDALLIAMRLPRILHGGEGHCITDLCLSEFGSMRMGHVERTRAAIEAIRAAYPLALIEDPCSGGRRYGIHWSAWPAWLRDME